MKSLLIYCTAFIVGFVIMGFEFFGTRVLSPYFGGGLHVWGALVSVVMGGLSCGYFLGGIAADKRSPERLLVSVVLLGGALLLIFPLLAVFVCEWINYFKLGSKVSTLIAALLLFFLPSFLMGCVSPLLVKLYVRTLSGVGQGSGTVYAVITVGSIAGTLATAFFFNGYLSSSVSIALFGVILVVNAAILFVVSRYFSTVFSR